MSLGFKPYLVALASLLAGASVVHAVLEPDLVSIGSGFGEENENEERRERSSLMTSFSFSHHLPTF